MDVKKIEVSQEELASEQQALAKKKEDEIRAGIIEEFGFDTTTDADRIEKLTKKEMDNQEKLSTAIGQKIKWRTEAGKPKEITPPVLGDDSEPKFSFRDGMILTRENVHEDDIDEVLDYAKFKKITVGEALKSPFIKTRLAETAEHRKTAEAANAGGGRPSNKTLTPDQIWEESKKGNIPARGSSEAEALFWSRRGGKKQ